MSEGRNYGLDGLRGVAAVIVICHHFHKVGRELTGGGYLAVDFFFVLSGYVIARAYEPRLRAGLGFGSFTRARVVRLYPMYALGAVLGVLHHLISGAMSNPEALPLGQSLVAFGLSLLMLPSYAAGSEELFPLNGPSWSLFFELFINLAFAAYLFRARQAVLVALAAAAGAWLGWWGVHGGTINWGWGWQNLDAGVARVGYSFALGCLFARWTAHTPTRQSWLALLNFPLMAAALLLPTTHGRPRDLFFGLILSPALVWLGTRYDVPAGAQKLCTRLGDISYPIYAVHFPIILFSVFIARRSGVSDTLTIPTVVVGLILLCHWLGTRVDPRLRHALAKRLEPRRPLQESGP